MKRLYIFIIFISSFLQASLLFDGESTHISMLNFFIPTQNTTYELWIHPEDIVDLQVIMYMWGSYNAWLYLENYEIHFHQDDEDDELSSNIQENAWSHVAITFNYENNSTFITLWINGENRGSLNTEYQINWSYGITIGKGSSSNGTDNFFQGLVSSIRISEVVLYNQNFNLNSNLIPDQSTFLLWNLNEQNSYNSLINDQSDNGYNGDLEGSYNFTDFQPSLDCSGVLYGDAELDECGVCDGDNSNCADCSGVLYGDAELDECGVCNGDNSNCADCSGVLYGDAELDECGVCNGDNSSCTGCTYSLAENYNLNHTIDDGSCIFNFIDNTEYINEDFDFCIDVGANLLSSPCSEEVAITEAIPSEIANNLTGIITQGGATSQIAEGVWVGSLNGLGGGKGYWFLSQIEGCFNYTCSE